MFKYSMFIFLLLPTVVSAEITVAISKLQALFDNEETRTLTVNIRSELSDIYSLTLNDKDADYILYGIIAGKDENLKVEISIYEMSSSKLLNTITKKIPNRKYETQQKISKQIAKEIIETIKENETKLRLYLTVKLIYSMPGKDLKDNAKYGMGVSLKLQKTQINIFKQNFFAELESQFIRFKGDGENSSSVNMFPMFINAGVNLPAKSFILNPYAGYGYVFSKFYYYKNSITGVKESKWYLDPVCKAGIDLTYKINYNFLLSGGLSYNTLRNNNDNIKFINTNIGISYQF